MAAIPLMYAQEDCELGGKESIEVRTTFLYRFYDFYPMN